MAQSIRSSSKILKVDFDGDTRRVSLTGVDAAPAAEILKRIRDTVANAFEMDEALLPVLKYQDDEGDLCTLVAASVADMLHINHGHAVRLFVAKTEEAVDNTIEASSDETMKELIDVAAAGTSGQDGDQTDVQSAAVAKWTHVLLQMRMRQSKSTSLEVAERHLASVANWHHLLQQMESHQNNCRPVVNRWHRLMQQMERNYVCESGNQVPESTQLEESTAATTLDNAQVLLSQSMSTIRSVASSLVRALRISS